MAARLVFLGTASFAVPTLEALVRSGTPPVAVYTRPDQPAGRGRTPRPSPVKERALALGLPVLQPLALRGLEATEELKRLAPTVLILAAYGLLLPPSFLTVAPKGGLNIHPSLLARHRGPSPVVWTLLEGDAEAGVTVFLMDEGMDSGPVLSQRSIQIMAGETAGSLTQRLAEEGARLLMETLRPWLDGVLRPVAQDSSQATYSRLLRKEDGELDFHRPAVQLERQVRAFQPWPGTFTRWSGQRLKILQAAALPGEGEPGAVVLVPADAARATKTQVGIATKDGVLGLLRVQPEGRRPMAAGEFVRGRHDFLGSSLPS